MMTVMMAMRMVRISVYNDGRGIVRIMMIMMMMMMMMMMNMMMKMMMKMMMMMMMMMMITTVMALRRYVGGSGIVQDNWHQIV